MKFINSTADEVTIRADTEEEYRRYISVHNSEHLGTDNEGTSNYFAIGGILIRLREPSKPIDYTPKTKSEGTTDGKESIQPQP